MGFLVGLYNFLDLAQATAIAHLLRSRKPSAWSASSAPRLGPFVFLLRRCGAAFSLLVPQVALAMWSVPCERLACAKRATNVSGVGLKGPFCGRTPCCSVPLGFCSPCACSLCWSLAWMFSLSERASLQVSLAFGTLSSVWLSIGQPRKDICNQPVCPCHTAGGMVTKSFGALLWLLFRSAFWAVF